MAVRRDVLFETGGFNPESFGDKWLGDGESGLVFKLRTRQLLIGYVPEALVYHHIPADRMTCAYACRRMANQGASDEYTSLHSTSLSKGLLLSRTVKVLGSLLKVFFAGMTKALYRGDELTRVAYKMHLSYNISRLIYLTRLMRCTQFRQMVSRTDWLLN